ncbi:hypothetical protein Bca4012_075826 [Brassica carinata]
MIPWKEEKKEFVSIGELHTFIANSSEQTEEADFLCKDQIVGVVQENGDTYEARRPPILYQYHRKNKKSAAPT